METLQNLTWHDAWYLTPEIALTLSALVLILLDLMLPKRINRDLIGWLTLLGLAVAAMFVIWLMLDMRQMAEANPTDPLAGIVGLLGGSYRLDHFGTLLKLVFLGAAGFIVLASLGTVSRSEVQTKGEMYYLLLPATLGAMVMASSADMITLYVGLELLSVTTYVLVGLRKRNSKSAEGAFKYLVSGGIGSALILYGMSFLYGVTGETNMFVMGESGLLDMAIADYRALVYVAFFLLAAGLGVKLALAPFHVWAADVYQGAPTPITSFLAVVTKGAVLAMLYRIFINSIFMTGQDRIVQQDLFLGLAILAAAAMIIGTAGALRQRNVKRLLALSGVANAGILVTPLAIDLTLLHSSLFSEFIYYLLAYVVMNVGAFAVLTIVSQASDGDETLTSFAGLYHRAPWTAVAMTVLLLSLAGFPITGGFFGKLFILFGTVQTGTYWLAAIMLVTTIVSYAVYFAFIKQMYMRAGTEHSEPKLPVPTGLSIWLCTAITLILGFLPGPIVSWIDDNFTILFDFMAR